MDENRVIFSYSRRYNSVYVNKLIDMVLEGEKLLFDWFYFLNEVRLLVESREERGVYDV